MPLSSIAMPITIAKVATLSAKYAVLSEVDSAVEVTQMLRAGLATGSPLLGSTAAAFSSFGALAGLVEVARHLGVGLAARRLERVLADHGGERLRLGAGVDQLVRDGRVGRPDDLLSRQVALDAVTTVDAGVDRADAERDEHDAGHEAAVLEELAHDSSLLRV